MSQCINCGADIEKVRVDRAIAGRVFRWCTVAGKQFYCPNSDGWHSPSAASPATERAGKPVTGERKER